MKQQPPLSKLLYYFLKKTSHNEIPKKDNWRDKKVPGLPLTPFFYKKKEDCILPHHMPPKYIRWSVNSTDQEMLLELGKKKPGPNNSFPQIHSEILFPPKNYYYR